MAPQSWQILRANTTGPQIIWSNLYGVAPGQTIFVDEARASEPDEKIEKEEVIEASKDTRGLAAQSTSWP